MATDWKTKDRNKQRALTIKGTSGSGKTTIVFKLLSQYTKRTPYFIPGRKQPIGYVFRAKGMRPLGVIGHYEAGPTGCGGLDSMPTYAAVTEMIKLFWDEGYNVMFEGLLASGDSKMTKNIGAYVEGKLRVLGLTTTMEQCLAAVNARRRAKDPDAPDVDPANTLSKFKAVPTTLERCREVGIQVKEVDRNEGWTWAAKIMGADPNSGWKLGDPDPTWTTEEPVNIRLQTLDEKGERIPGLVWSAEHKDFRIDPKTLERETKMLELKEQKRKDRKMAKGGTVRPSSTYGSMAPPGPNASEEERAAYRRWRQARRAERKARKAAQALNMPWPPLEGMYSKQWHEEQRAAWAAEQAKLLDQVVDIRNTEDEESEAGTAPLAQNLGKPLPTVQAGAWQGPYLSQLEQEVQFLSNALAQALARLEAARKL